MFFQSPTISGMVVKPGWMILLLGVAVQRLSTGGQHHYLRTNQRHRHPDSTPTGWSQDPGHRARLLNPTGNPGMPKFEGDCCNPFLLVDLMGLPWDCISPPPKEICLTWVMSGDWKLLQTPLYEFCCLEPHEWVFSVSSTWQYCVYLLTSMALHTR